MNRAAVVLQLKQTRETLDKLLTCSNLPSVTDSFPTFNSPVESIYRRANAQASQANRSSAVSSQPFRSPRAWGLRVSFANGNTSCGSASKSLGTPFQFQVHEHLPWLSLRKTRAASWSDTTQGHGGLSLTHVLIFDRQPFSAHPSSSAISVRFPTYPYKGPAEPDVYTALIGVFRPLPSVSPTLRNA